ncbi:GAF domain-containing protein [Kribbella capetownensis]|uniref:GAF domain-containing protein n=1 Tax=Kribbella capetownensis TaxID=1572659 RepID=UPI00192DC5E6|nr:GAF domain-containing protein [Kribbella capetownensis]
MDRVDRGLHRRHEEFLEGGERNVRGLVAASWGRSIAAGLDSGTAAPFAFRADELSAYRAEHPLAAVFPMLYDVLGRAAEDSDSVMAIGDSDGRLLWVCGRRDVLRAADGIHFSEGAWWAERQVGTNALGTSLEVAGPVQIRSAEHFTLLVQPWSCAAAPIYDPETQRVLGVVDVTGGADASSPQSLALVRAAARMAEAELGRLTILRRITGDSGHRVHISALGRPDAEVRVDDRDLRLSRRHSDILVLLAEHPEGLSAEELSDALYGEADHRSSLRGEVTRLRALLGADIVESRPYRLRRDIAADWLETANDLDSHLLSSALRRYVGPLLPQSDAPGVVAARNRLENRIRAAVLQTQDVDLVVAWTRSYAGVNDLAAWEHQLTLLSPTSPLWPAAQSEVRRLRKDYGLNAAGTEG